MTKLLLLFTIFSVAIAYSQSPQFQPDPPNYDLIEKEIKDEKSKFYYPVLMERYMKNDTTLTMEEYKYLYYGYVYQPKYRPYWHCDNIEKLVNYYKKENFTEADKDEIIKLAKECIEDFPFDIRQMNMISYIYYLKGDEENSYIWAMKTQSIIHTILYTGSGLNENEAWHVIITGHEYEIIKSLEFEAASQALVPPYYDVISLKQNDTDIKAFYFNVQKILEANAKMFDVK